MYSCRSFWRTYHEQAAFLDEYRDCALLSGNWDQYEELRNGFNKVLGYIHERLFRSSLIIF